ncbi:galactitol-specific phosphotransferase enzyme IIB component [Peptococcaceae bacterium CEB3]|nr:galactitol-specific phosphotransferase enzyme IIB component [Peptococcaceae bacterium CEB3]
MKKIIVACGSGVATSQTVASKVKDLCEKKGLRVQVEAINIRNLEAHIKNCDMYISITPYEKKDYGVPVVSGIPFLTGVGLDVAMKQIEEVLRK